VRSKLIISSMEIIISHTWLLQPKGLMIGYRNPPLCPCWHLLKRSAAVKWICFKAKTSPHLLCYISHNGNIVETVLDNTHRGCCTVGLCVRSPGTSLSVGNRHTPVYDRPSTGHIACKHSNLFAITHRIGDRRQGNSCRSNS
jgi:hypothetical protein